MIEDQLRHLVETVLEKLSIPCKVEVSSEELNYQVRITTDEPALIIGQNGETLDALQTIIRLLAYQQSLTEIRITIDINDYRSQKQAEMLEFVKGVAERVKQSGKPETLRSMTAYERRLVHQLISEIGGLKSDSLGEGRERRVVIDRVASN